jgi:hypothetical protein
VDSKIFDGGEDTENEYDAGGKVLANNGYSASQIDEITQYLKYSKVFQYIFRLS